MWIENDGLIREEPFRHRRNEPCAERYRNGIVSPRGFAGFSPLAVGRDLAALPSKSFSKPHPAQHFGSGLTMLAVRVGKWFQARIGIGLHRTPRRPHRHGRRGRGCDGAPEMECLDALAEERMDD